MCVRLSACFWGNCQHFPIFSENHNYQVKSARLCGFNIFITPEFRGLFYLPYILFVGWQDAKGFSPSDPLLFTVCWLSKKKSGSIVFII